jgi:hypothetical protein
MGLGISKQSKGSSSSSQSKQENPKTQQNQQNQHQHFDLIGKPYGLAVSILRPSKIPISLIALKEEDIHQVTPGSTKGYIILYDATTGLVKDILE